MYQFWAFLIWKTQLVLFFELIILNIYFRFLHGFKNRIIFKREEFLLLLATCSYFLTMNIFEFCIKILEILHQNYEIYLKGVKL